MIFEFRTYEPHDGKTELLRARFETETLRLFKKHDIVVEAVLRPEPDDGRLCYVTRFETEDARQAAWARFQGDEEWRAIKAASEQDGPLLKAQQVLVMKALNANVPAF